MMRYQQEVRELRPVELDPGEVMTLTEAAGVLGLSASAVADLTLRGALRRYVDTEEPNPQKANRVLRSDVLTELERRRRRYRRGDARLRGVAVG